VRVNANGLITFRTRNEKEYLALAEEASAFLDKDQFRRVYQLATKEPYSFLYMKLDAKKLNDIFYIRFEKKIPFLDEEDEDESEEDEPHRSRKPASYLRKG